MTPTPDESLWPAWFDAASQEPIDRAIVSLYAELDAAVAQRGPTCWLSGKCCHFNAYGHRLYVTGLEIAWVVRQVSQPKPRSTPGDDRAHPHPSPLPEGEGVRLAVDGGCMFQQNKLCSIHAVRPLGCRIFFCQEGTQDWQHELYETFLTRLRALHETHGLPYRYMEWRAGLTDATAYRVRA